ncbi:hypothetical protein NDU88_008769 [Pleurodeles waltl]|uniref:Uncharacterized protein n=1 Tax=Pleurodeles waltl TaxID=8319 RepID=A0AAV7RTC6_PLEWA|nr:hypothetical protein NDU88_008769 [Pleurodeles waltl]
MDTESQGLVRIVEPVTGTQHYNSGAKSNLEDSAERLRQLITIDDASLDHGPIFPIFQWTTSRAAWAIVLPGTLG